MDRSYQLRNRALLFAKSVIALTRDLPPSSANAEFSRQVIRSSASIGANYVEANDALGKRDFLMKIRTARREANETRYWLELLEYDLDQKALREQLLDEALQLAKIFSAIIRSVEAKSRFAQEP